MSPVVIPDLEDRRDIKDFDKVVRALPSSQRAHGYDAVCGLAQYCDGALIGEIFAKYCSKDKDKCPRTFRTRID